MPAMPAGRAHPGSIRAVTFDLDDTLWDVRPAIERAERELRAWLEAHCPDMAAAHDRDALFRIRSRLVHDTPRLAHDVSELRVQVLRAALGDTGYPQAEAERLARAGFEVFIDARHCIEYYDHAPGVLRLLGRRYLVGALTNGNADVRRLDIGPFFRFAIQAGEVGAGKPAPAMFEEAMRRTRLGPDAMVHVGDDLVNDVAGARRLGWRTIWVNRAGIVPPPGSAAADGEISCLSELPDAVAHLDAA